MYIKKYWGNFIGGSDDSLNLVAFLVDQKKEEIPLSEIFAKIGLDKQNWDFRQTVEYLEFTHSDGVEMDFHFAIDGKQDGEPHLLQVHERGITYNPRIGMEQAKAYQIRNQDLFVEMLENNPELKDKIINSFKS